MGIEFSEFLFLSSMLIIGSFVFWILVIHDKWALNYLIKSYEKGKVILPVQLDYFRSYPILKIFFSVFIWICIIIGLIALFISLINPFFVGFLFGSIIMFLMSFFFLGIKVIYRRILTHYNYFFNVYLVQNENLKIRWQLRYPKNKYENFILILLLVGIGIFLTALIYVVVTTGLYFLLIGPIFAIPLPLFIIYQVLKEKKKKRYSKYVYIPIPLEKSKIIVMKSLNELHLPYSLKYNPDEKWKYKESDYTFTLEKVDINIFLIKTPDQIKKSCSIIQINPLRYSKNITRIINQLNKNLKSGIQLYC